MKTLLRPHLTELIPGVFCLGLSAYMLLDVLFKPAIATKAAVGPGMFPTVIGTCLALVGVRLCHEAWQRRGTGEPFLDLDIRMAFQGAMAFLVMILTLEWLGWVVAGTLMYATVAHAFGERRVIRSLLLGLGLTGLTYFLFDRLLDLSLPVGALVDNLLAYFGYEI